MHEFSDKLENHNTRYAYKLLTINYKLKIIFRIPGSLLKPLIPLSKAL